MTVKIKIAITVSQGDSKASNKRTLSRTIDCEEVPNPRSALKDRYTQLDKQLKQELGDIFDNGQTSLSEDD